MPAARLRSVAWAGALVLLALLQLQPPAGAEPYAPWRPLRCTRYDTSITVLDDGSLAVVEIFTLLFPDGDASRSGWLELPTGRSNGIDRIEVLELREDGAIPFRPVPPIKFSG